MKGKEMKQEKKQNPNDLIVVSSDNASVEDDSIEFGKIFGMLLEHIQYIILCFLVGALLFN